MSKGFVSAKQNLSGHVTFDSQQTRFFQECNAKVNNIERRRECGMLTFKPARNPMTITEPDSRDEFHGFDFKIPPKKEEPDRWNYPKDDWGIMSKFNTQKQIYDDIKYKAENYKTIVKEFRAIREKNEKIFADELKKEKEKFHAEELEKQKIASSPTNAANPNRIIKNQLNSRGAVFKEDEQLLRQIERAASKHSKSQGDRNIHNQKALDSLTYDSRSSYNYMANPKSSAKLEPIDFYDNKISTIKDLGVTHPEVLAKWRAERAAQYVDKNGQSALQPPVHRATGTKPFHPGGNSIKVVEAMAVPAKKSHSTTSLSTSTNQRHQQQQQQQQQQQNSATAAAAVSSNVDAASMALNMKALQAALDQTNSDIERQRLKIALNKKPEKGFQKAKDLRVTINNT